ncbi:MAG: FliM/FliN family flagellar motor switch protein [Thermoguttaceae bacterium]|nr:FliM/FliN family flagellar motor switch protein [Thermoguttaceae bacterium]
MSETSLNSQFPASPEDSKPLGEEEFLESLNLAAPKSDGAGVQLDSGRTSPFLLNLAGSLERFLDVVGEVFELSLTSENGVSRKRPRTFEGDGFAVSFPFEEGIGVFLAADGGEILASWLQNPGIAGKSRILLLANELERLFSSDQDGTSDPENSEETPSETKPFYTGPDFFYGRITGLESLFEALPMETLAKFRSFTIRKFDGREGYAWMFGPLSSAEILVDHEVPCDASTRSVESPRPVRSLECVEVETAGTTLPASSIEPSADSGTTLPASSTEPPAFSETIYRFHFRTPLYSPKMRARREEFILSQIRYEHPMNTQRWRVRAKKTSERFLCEIQAAMLIAAYSRSVVPVPSPVPTQPTLQIPPMTSLVETKIPCEGIDPVQIVDFQSFVDEPFEPVSVTLSDWSENSFIVSSLIEPEKTTDVSHEGEIQPEMLMETDVKAEPIELPHVMTPFAEDFSEEEETEAFPALTAPVDVQKMLEVPVPVSILLGRRRVSVSEILGWKKGTILNLGQKIDKTCEVFVNGGCAGRGFPVEYENRVGARVQDLRLHK